MPKSFGALTGSCGHASSKWGHTREHVCHDRNLICRLRELDTQPGPCGSLVAEQRFAAPHHVGARSASGGAAPAQLSRPRARRAAGS